MELGRFLSGFGRQQNDDDVMPESVRAEAADALDARPVDRSRVPPGQWITRGWPVLTYGSTPRFDPARWDLRIVGLVENPLTWDYETFMGLPTKKVLCDIHCVTTWSLLDNVFEGVPAEYVAEQAGIKPEATHVIAHAEQGYTANLPLGDFLRDDVLLAYKHNGENLIPRPRLAAAPDGAPPLFLEERQVAARPGIRQRRRTRLLGSARLPHARRSLDRRTLRVRKRSRQWSHHCRTLRFLGQCVPVAQADRRALCIPVVQVCNLHLDARGEWQGQSVF